MFISLTNGALNSASLSKIWGKNKKIIHIFGIRRDAMKHYLRKIFFIIPTVLLSFSLSIAQEFRTITGKVVDSNSGYPLPYASVSISNSSYTNVANSEGEFSLKFPLEQINDSVIVSYLGYRNLFIPISDLIGNKNNKVMLTPTTIDIRSITVRPNDALTIFTSAFSSKSIKHNYLTVPVGMSGFYREIIKRGNKYLSLNEAVVDIHKQSYLSSLSDNISIYKGRGNTNRTVSDTLFLQLQGGPVSTLQLDIVKDPFIAVDLFSAPQYYEFKMGPMFFMDNLNIYTIDFDQVADVSDILFRGRIYIESQTLAIMRIEFEMNVQGRNDSWKAFVRKKPDDMQIGVDWAKYQINYRQHNEKWYVDYARIDLRFTAKYKGKLLKNKYDITTELAITDIDNKSALNIESNQRFKMKDILQNKVNDFRDDYFWENYNIIEPDQKIENIINRIIRQLKKERN